VAGLPAATAGLPAATAGLPAATAGLPAATAGLPAAGAGGRPSCPHLTFWNTRYRLAQIRKLFCSYGC
jgi:hypothetical protein